MVTPGKTVGFWACQADDSQFRVTGIAVAEAPSISPNSWIVAVPRVFIDRVDSNIKSVEVKAS